MGRGRCAIATLIVCLGSSGCLSDLKEPPGRDGGPGAVDSGGGEDGSVGPKCDPAGLFDEPEPLATAGGSINDGVEQAWPRVSRDGLTLYYVEASTRDGGRLLNGAVLHVGRAGGEADADFDMTTAVAEDEFTASDNNDAPFLSSDERRLYFSNGADKVYASDRDGSEGPFPYPGAELGLNAEGARDVHPYLVGDTLYFSTSREGGDGSLKLYRSVGVEGAFETAEPINLITASPHFQWAPVVSSDHRVIFFSADGALYRAVRQPSGSFDMAEVVEELDEAVSYPGSLSADDCVLYFHSDRRAGTDFDIFVAQATVTFGG